MTKKIETPATVNVPESKGVQVTARTESTRPVTASDGVTGRWQDNADGSCEFIPDAPRPGALALAFLTAEVERVDPLFRAGVSGELRGAQKYASEAVADVQALLARCEAAEAALANAEMGIRATSQALAAAKADAERLAKALDTLHSAVADIVSDGTLSAEANNHQSMLIAAAALAAHRAGGGK